MGGYKNRILRINLTDRSFSEESLSKDLIYDYIGGRGFGIKLLYDDLKQDTDPLGEANELIFIAGPLAGTNAQSFGRWKVFFKSPLTGTYFMSSAGGHWAEELKLAGFDTVIIKGTSELPVYLWIFRISKIQAIGNSNWFTTRTDYITCGFCNGNLSTYQRVQVYISSITIGTYGKAFPCTLQADDSTVTAGSLHCITSNSRIVLVIDKVFTSNIG